MPSLSENAIRYAPWSMSKAKLALECPLAHHLRYVKKQKMPAVIGSPAQRIGKAAHYVLEQALLGKEMRRAIREGSFSNRLTSVEVEELLSMVHSIRAFDRRIREFSEKHGVQDGDKYVEYQFAVDQGWQPTKYFGKDVFLRVVWDLLLKVDDRIVIIDHKTGTAVPERELVQRYGAQLNFYMACAMCRFPDARSVRMAYHFIAEEELTWLREYGAEEIRGKLFPWVIEYLNRAAESATRFDPVIGWACKFCEYISICPAKNT